MKEILGQLWGKLPPKARLFVACCALVTCMSCGLIIGWLAWDSGYIRQRLGMVATTDDLQQQTEAINTASSVVVADAIDQALDAYDDNLRAYMQRERKWAEDTILKPMVQAIRQHDDQLKLLLDATNANTSRLDAIPHAQVEQMQRLIDQATGSNEMVRLLRELNNRIDRLEQDASRQSEPRKQSKQRF